MISFTEENLRVSISMQGWPGYCGGVILCNPQVVDVNSFAPASEKDIERVFGSCEDMYDRIYDEIIEERCYGKSATSLLITTTPYVDVGDYSDGSGHSTGTMAATLEPMARHWGAELIYETVSRKTGNVVHTYMLDISEEVCRRLSIQQKNAMREIEDEEDERQRQAAADWGNQLWNAFQHRRSRPADERSYQDYQETEE